MKNWLKQTSTIGGFLMLAITGVEAAQSGGNWYTVALAVLSAALMVVRDGKFLAGLCALLMVGQVSSGCASVQLPVDQQITIGCAAMEVAGCFEGIQDVFPGINASNCPDRINYLNDIVIASASGKPSIDTAKVVASKIDLSKVDITKLQTLRRASCRNAETLLGVK